MKLQSIKKGFTLIELLVVITIIGILATGGVSVFTTQLQGARDSTRVNDMKLMETAIHQSFNDQSAYPDVATFTGAISGYMSKALKDPNDGKTICWDDTDNVDGGTDQTNTATCGGYYVRTNDTFGLTDAAFKLGVAFEKRVNTENKAIKANDGWNTPDFFETFSWDGSFDLRIGSGWSAAASDATLSTHTGSTGTNGSIRIY